MYLEDHGYLSHSFRNRLLTVVFDRKRSTAFFISVDFTLLTKPVKKFE